MKRLWLRVRVPLLIFLVALIIPSTPKTSAFFSLSRAWYAHWPFEVGRSLPNYATVIMGRFVPVWAEVKPHVNMLLDPYDAVTGVILSQGTWEPATLQVLEEHMPPGGTFIDVGETRTACHLAPIFPGADFPNAKSFNYPWDDLKSFG